MAKTSFSELNLKNAFLFAAVMSDTESCRLILEMILDKPIGKVSVNTEHSILLNSDYRSVRLDVYAIEDKQISGGETAYETEEAGQLQVDYNVEMQNDRRTNLAKRSRYYQAEIDVASLKPGEDIDNLRPNYVIFICTYDPFGYGLYRYVFENRCVEQGFPLNDGTMKIFLNTKGKNPEAVPDVLVDFLKYIEVSTDSCAQESKDKRIELLHQNVMLLKKSRELESRYMRFGELLDVAANDAKAEGRAEGRAEGKEMLINLICLMEEAGEGSLISKLGKDSAFLEEMLEKYHLNV